MSIPTVVISGTGIYHPSDLISNEELVASFNLYVDEHNQKNKDLIEQGIIGALEYSSEGFIEKASGIKQRYVIDKKGILDVSRMRPKIDSRAPEALSLHAELGIKAIEKALAKAKLTGDKLDAIIVSCSMMQRAYPGIAMEIQNHFNAKGFAFDMSVACSSATFGLNMGYQLILGGQAKHDAVVTPEITSGHLDYSQRESHFIFGDASAAVILERQDVAKANHLWKIISTKLATSFSNNIRNEFGFINRLESEDSDQKAETFNQQGRKVFKEVIPLASDHIMAHCEAHNLNGNEIRRYWLHQANHHMNELIAKRLLGRDPSHDDAPLILDTYANTAAAGCVIAFDHFNEDLKTGDLGIMCSFGAGYSVGSLLIEKL